MKAHLLYKDRDFDWRLVRQAQEEREIAKRGWRRRDETYFNPHRNLPWNAETLTADLALDTLFEAMADDDDCIYETVRRVILTSVDTDVKTIRYRQQVLQECLEQPALLTELYELAGRALAKKREHYLSEYTKDHPDAFLRESISIIEELLDALRELNRLADAHADAFTSPGWSAFFAMLKKDLAGDYLDEVKHHLKQLNMRHENLLLSAALGEANKGTNYLLHEPPRRETGLWAKSKALFTKETVYSFRVHPRDTAGSEALDELRDRGIGKVAAAVGQSGENIADFFDMLQVEVAFYLGCLNLQKRLKAQQQPVALPTLTSGGHHLRSVGLYDPTLALTTEKRVVGNDVEAKDKDLILITGPNTGGKSTFLRSVGIAQLMAQAGMFVAASSFETTTYGGIFTHYKREEDASMESGKFDEELKRMSEIVDHIRPGSLMLFNESFAATNEREGSEIARQILSALLERGTTVVCVTHQFELASGFYKKRRERSLFLQAERKADGTRTFKMIQGEPEPTSHGEDLYRAIFKDKQRKQRKEQA